MKYADFKKSILAASTQEEIATIIQLAAKESMEASQFGGFKKEWTLEQHIAEESKQAKSILESKGDIPNTGKLGYAGTARDYARGFDGIE